MKKNNEKKEDFTQIEDKSYNKGFITIATGIEKYHKMAYILLQSYKNTTKNPCRFGVITDCESKYTEAFDDVVVVKDATKTYMDKLELLNNSPYQETIFIDADCIAFNDLNEYWHIFNKSTDMSAFGEIMPLNSSDGWYRSENLGKYKNSVEYCQDFHGGIYYFKKSDVTRKIYENALDISKNYESYKFKGFSKPADEPIFALAMAANNCKPTKSENRYFAWLRRTQHIKADFFSKKLSYDVNGNHVKNGMLLHFGTAHTIMPLYIIESKKVLYFSANKKSWTGLKKVYGVLSSFMESLVQCVIYSNKVINKRKKI